MYGKIVAAIGAGLMSMAGGVVGSALAPAAAPAPPPAAVPASCYPVSDSGTRYRPGEFCRTSDHGATGRTADGEAIVCRYKGVWRWEPA